MLSFKGCSSLTDSGVSWLADKVKSLISLNVKVSAGIAAGRHRVCLMHHDFDVRQDCSVSRAGLKAMLPNWKFVEFRDDEKCLGFGPEYRGQDKKFIEDYGEAWAAACRIQALFRARQAMRSVAALRRERVRIWAVRKIQSQFRGRRARAAAIILRMQRRRLDDSAIIIQRRARIVLARKKAAKRRQIAYRLRLEEAARMVQKSWRGKKARDLARTAREALLEYRRKAEAAAIMVQRHWRGLAGRRWMLAYRKWLAEAGERQRQAALQIQRIVRGKLGKLRVKRIRARNEWIKKNQWKAAMVVQVRSCICPPFCCTSDCCMGVPEPLSLGFCLAFPGSVAFASSSLAAELRPFGRNSDCAMMLQCGSSPAGVHARAAWLAMCSSKLANCALSMMRL